VRFHLTLVVALGIATSGTAQNDFIRSSTPLSAGRAFHGTAVMGDWLYVFGGSSATPGRGGEVVGGEAKDASVLKARIAADGSTGPWEKTTSLPQPRHYVANSTLALNDAVYIVGGSDAPSGGKRFDNALYTRPLADGTLSPWTASPSFGEGLSTITAVTTPGHIHLIGGLRGDDQPTASVKTSTLRPDGSMGSWTDGPPLPIAVWFHHAGVAGGRAWVWGGLPHGDSPNGPRKPTDRVFSSPILASGELGPWREEAVRLPVGMYSASSAVAGPYLISFAPRYEGGQHSADIVWTFVSPDGIKPWQRRSTEMPHRLYHAVAPNYRLGTIHVTGGRPERGAAMTAGSTILALSPAARGLAEETWIASRQGIPAGAMVAALQAPRPEVHAVSLSYLAEERVTVGALPGFNSVAQARRIASSQRMPLVMYFNMAGAPPCEQQKAEMLKPPFVAASSAAVFAWVDTAEHPQLAQQLGVYRVPTWVFYDRNGAELVGARTVGATSAEQLARTVLGIR